MTGIFVYLTVCSIRNSVRVQIRRLRQPRYLLIAIGFVLYVGAMMLGRPASGSFGRFVVDGTGARMIAAAVATLMLGSAWLLPPGAALRFTSAEVQFLFTAPVTRRQLIAYKVCRLLLGAAASGAFLTIFVGPPRLVPGLIFAAKSAAVVAILTLHGAGVGMNRSRAKEQEQLPVRRWQILAAVCLLTPILGGGLAFIALASGMELAAALPVAVLLTGVNALWIIRSDSAFEEAATDAADKMSRAIATGHFSTPRISRKRSSTFRLRPSGPAETAILWKNWLLLGRASRPALVSAAILLALVVTVHLVVSDGVVAADLIGDLSMFFVALAVLLGPAMLRLDLRQDLGHLAVIKTWPVRGPALIRGELLAPSIALSLSAAVAIVIGSAFAPGLPFVDHAGAGARVVFAISAVLATTAVVVAQLVVHNGIAVSYPAWVELKVVASGEAAMTMNVRMMIVMYGALLVLAFVLVIPVAAAFVAYFVSGGLLIPSAIFAAFLACESLAATEIIGRILDRTDLQDVVVTD
jgi:ABC-2 type transport system permease protein